MQGKVVFKLVDLKSSDYEMMMDLRYKVLREPLGLIYNKDDLEEEVDQYHLAGFSDSQLIACVLLKVVDEDMFKIRQFAVDRNFQGRGIGAELVRFIEEFSGKKKVYSFEMHARESAVKFYEKLGFTIVGERFTEVGLPHFKMIKSIK